MVDVVISYAQGNEATVRQLAEAVTRLGYAVWQSDAPSDASNADAVTEQVAAAGATIVIWSEAAAASEWVRADANVARGLKKLVQVTADGRPPPVPFDPTQMISVLTWRGEEDHPAWRGIKARLADLCGPPAAPAPAPVESAATAPAPPPPPIAPAAPSKGPSGLLIALIVILAVAVLAAAGYYWMQRDRPGEAAPSLELNGVEPAPAPAEPGAAPPSAQSAAPAPEAAAEPFDREAVIQGVDHAFVRSTPSGIGFNIARVDAGEVFATYEQSGDWWRVRTASGRTGYMNMAVIRLRGAAAPGQAQAEPGPADQASPPARPDQRADQPDRRAEPRRPRGPRIRKENSEVMVAFCQGAGRGTPQCRSFGRSTY